MLQMVCISSLWALCDISGAVCDFKWLVVHLGDFRTRGHLFSGLGLCANLSPRKLYVVRCDKPHGRNGNLFEPPSTSQNGKKQL